MDRSSVLGSSSRFPRQPDRALWQLLTPRGRYGDIGSRLGLNLRRLTDTRRIFSELVELLNHLVGQQRVRQIKTERLCGLGIDDEFESCGPLNRQFGNFGTF